MESKTNKKRKLLLPIYFKKIGLAMIFLSIIPAIIIKSINFELTAFQKQILLNFTFDVFIIGVSFIAWSRDKIEDEMTISLRLQIAAATISAGAIYVIIRPLEDLIFKNTPISNVSGREIIFLMLSLYLLMYYLQKFRR